MTNFEWQVSRIFFSLELQNTILLLNKTFKLFLLNIKVNISIAIASSNQDLPLQFTIKAQRWRHFLG
jgi:hypothetical protein